MRLECESRGQSLRLTFHFEDDKHTDVFDVYRPTDVGYISHLMMMKVNPDWMYVACRNVMGFQVH